MSNEVKTRTFFEPPVRSDKAFTYKMSGYEPEIKVCRARFYWKDRVIIGPTETGEPLVPSITNSICEIANQLCEQFSIPHRDLLLVEHQIRSRDNKDLYYLVIFNTNLIADEFRSPKWIPITHQAALAIMEHPKW